MPHTLPPFPEHPANDPKSRRVGTALFGLTLGMILLFLAATIQHADDIARLVMLALGMIGVIFGLLRSQNNTVHERMDVLVKAVKVNYDAIKIVKQELNRVEEQTEHIEEDLTNVEAHLGIPHRHLQPGERTLDPQLEEHEEGGPVGRTRSLDPPPTTDRLPPG